MLRSKVVFTALKTWLKRGLQDRAVVDEARALLRLAPTISKGQTASLIRRVAAQLKAA